LLVVHRERRDGGAAGHRLGGHVEALAANADGARRMEEVPAGPAAVDAQLALLSARPEIPAKRLDGWQHALFGWDHAAISFGSWVARPPGGEGRVMGAPPPGRIGRRRSARAAAGTREGAVRRSSRRPRRSRD